jgi:NADPH2 dehydrogenase
LCAGPLWPRLWGDGTGLGIDLTEPLAFLDECAKLGVQLVCITAGSPYYNPHIQRPACNPPCDGYLPPEDPLLGVNRQVQAVAQLKKARPGMLLVGSGYTYLQEFLPHVAQAVVRSGMADSIGIGRGLLSYPDMVADILEGKPLDRKRVCRTISDCTTAPRKGLVSGCYPLDEGYRKMPEYQRLAEMKKGKG